MNLRIFLKVSNFLLCLTLLAGWIGCSSILLAQERVLQINSTSGAKMRSLISGDAAKAKANLILLVGSGGALKISEGGELKYLKGNFLARSRRMFENRGYLVALVDAPMDQKKPQNLDGFRASKEHASDLGIVAKNLFSLNGKPVVVIGTSRGTVSAANLGLRDQSGLIKAVILTSALVRRNKKGESLNELNMKDMKLPLLFIHNKSDKCNFTLLEDVGRLATELKKDGVDVKLVVVNSVIKTGRNCGSKSPHGFLGIEDKVVSMADEWLISRNCFTECN